MSKTGSYVRICESSVAENLITGYMAAGVKLAAPIYRLFWGTSEIIAVLINCKKEAGTLGMKVKQWWQT